MTLPLGEGEREEGEGSEEEEEGDGEGAFEGEWDDEGPLLNYYGSTFEELVPDPDAPAYLPPSRKGRRPTREDKGTWKGNERALEEVRASDKPWTPHNVCRLFCRPCARGAGRLARTNTPGSTMSAFYRKCA